MPHTLIIGYGNPLRGDDGVGPRAAELLADRGGVTPPLLPDGVQVLVCHQLTIELAPQIAEADRLILIDARATGEPGSIEQCILTPAIPDSTSLTHHIDARGFAGRGGDALRPRAQDDAVHRERRLVRLRRDADACRRGRAA